MQCATLVYEKLNDIKNAVDYTKKLLAATPDTPENADFRKEMAKKKAELEAKVP